jgi:PKD repeat protein
MKKLATLSISLLLASFASQAQTEVTKPCGTNEAMEEVFHMYPELRSNYEAHQLLMNSQVITTNSEGKSEVQYVIPVVFHVMHEYGNENISDAQIYDAMEVINREFNAADPDSVQLVPPFDDLIGNGRITFKLASIDPWGNCTNGIEHIYTHESNFGDAYSKLNQWNRAKYFNIWTTKVVGAIGAAAYAIKPAGTDGSGFWLDGVMSNHSYVGSIGTGSPGVESTLTHEIGHSLDLSHPWGDTNDPMVSCGDDGVADTPETEGWSFCQLSNNDVCNPGTPEDVQNYMDYSYCSFHFTPGQVERMHNALEGIAGQRNNLWQEETLIATGVKDLEMPQDPSNLLSVPLCAPVADFYSPNQLACVNDFVSFEDASWNAVIDSRLWEFEGGSPATSTSANPNVQWSTPGYKKVKLTVTNAAGTDSREVSNYIYVSPQWADFTGPKYLDIEGNQNFYFIVKNPEDNYGKFEAVNGVGYNGSKGFRLGNFKDVSDADPYTADWFYNGRLGGSIDQLISPSFNLATTSAVTVTFKYAYATNATDEEDITEALRVSSSRNCGETWTPRILSVEGSSVGTEISGADLVSAGFAGNANFTPSTNAQWRTASFTYSTNSTDTRTRFMFEFEASDLANNLYIDEILIDGVLGITSDELDMEFEIYPNPTNGEAINVSYYAQNSSTEFTLRDVQGKVITHEVVDATNVKVNHTLSNTENLPSAPYFLEVRSNGFSFTKKVVVL